MSPGKVAHVFPGVGIRLSGHEAPFFARHEQVMAPPLAEASRFAELDLEAPLRGGGQVPGGERGEHLFTFALSCAVSTVYRRAGLEPALVGGHSLGIYATLVSAGVLSFAHGLEATDVARQIVTRHAQDVDGSMAVIVGLSQREVEHLLARVGDEPPAPPRDRRTTARLVNSNNDTSHVLAGLRADLSRAVDAALAADALKATLLPVTAPYHHPELLPDASAEFLAHLRGIEFRPPSCPVVSSIDGALLSSPEALRELTAANLSTPIRWDLVARTLGAEGVDLAAECGPGISLTQNGRLIDGAPRFVSLKGAERRLGVGRR